MKRRSPFPSARKPAASVVNAADEAEYRRAFQCYGHGRYDEALALCERLRSRPDFEGKACLVLGCIQLLRQETEAAESALRIAAQKVGSANAWYNFALALKATNKLEQAEEAYRKTLQLDPKQPYAWSNLGNLLNHGDDRERLHQAIECYRRAIELQPDYARAHVNLGSAYKDNGQNKDAERHYRKALEIAPDFMPALTNLAELLGVENKPERAEEVFRKILQLDPKEPHAWNSLGSLLHRGHNRERFQEALECYRRAIELQPDYHQAHINLGRLYTRLDQQEKAEWHYRKALEIAPDSTPALTNLAELLKATNRSEEALSLYRKAWELEPDQIARMAYFIDQRRRLADWSDTAGPQAADLVAAIKNRKNDVIPPVSLLALPEALPDLLRETAARL
ncbi:MAG: tetratricopeptide repeat protein, partial [Desulfobulbaceae bacterium]|nr:tetratricopeptide repeat protein [Desulfobulbaceae bacterium]